MWWRRPDHTTQDLVLIHTWLIWVSIACLPKPFEELLRVMGLLNIRNEARDKLLTKCQELSNKDHRRDKMSDWGY